MTEGRNTTNKSKSILTLGTLASLIIVGGVLYQAQKDLPNDSELLSIPEQAVEVFIAPPIVPEATIPEALNESDRANLESSTPSDPLQSLLPDLDTSDDFVRERILLMSNKPEINIWLSADDLIRRAASYLDGLSRGVILGKIFPLSSPKSSFATHNDGDVIWLNAGNYDRYNTTIAVIASLDMKSVAQMFHFARPLLESAFLEMGYKPRQMDGILLTALDQVLNTPIIAEPIRLTRDSVAYKYADMSLESLTPLQKQLIRTGPENTQRLQQQALALKNALLDPNGTN
ncbi:MAG: DUF3014 domain-containing protein [Proteobacteria bacterium]|mgnify:FL=1|jgi:hypothetical protein|uniref:DUF3014 domain-containing protein n=1 Tax=SAR92 bacterium BACL26 MAG-121220-bin70 TaxID=1655626 RepID=A0A0R2UC86_9GAMM|nr:MAG: hypothetical protein ABS24_10600 [SAR92 bacterium BACL26 MAG-121220-bin70]MDA0795707.1 DUF3014 domain-containing protein [Pseudomonadota bacterium]MDA1352033.1 DUF3014 domain-containing protein [Pseudomonadota bacterium]|tara:strand:- start:4273 stop:5136 length:864 start_codon:yes stop_codon:yes gene_type:complete